MADGHSSEGADRVVLDEPERQSLLGLLLKNLLVKNLSDDRVFAKARALDGEVELGAGPMTVTLRFDGERLTLLSRKADRPKAWVRGEMAALLAVARGGGMVGPYLRGELRAGGSPFVLLKLLPLLRAAPEGDAKES